jgi:hypothetical protein
MLEYPLTVKIYEKCRHKNRPKSGKKCNQKAEVAFCRDDFRFSTRIALGKEKKQTGVKAAYYVDGCSCNNAIVYHYNYIRKHSS